MDLLLLRAGTRSANVLSVATFDDFGPLAPRRPIPLAVRATADAERAVPSAALREDAKAEAAWVETTTDGAKSLSKLRQAMMREPLSLAVPHHL